jgi:uncharacterized protein YprB with RNaseH-like and TPR domain/predicted nuclease with RNAse H fold/dephospho-CoA kinase
MIENTFRHLKGIGAKKEQELWKSKIFSWDDFDARQDHQLLLFKDELHDYQSSILESSRKALKEKNINFFAEALPREEHYRIALAFPDETLFLDIETTGLSKYYDDITLIGLGTNRDYKLYLNGDNLDHLNDLLSLSKIIVTFNGSLFDIPFIRHKFSILKIPLVHIDLRFLAKRVGLSGGQKEIEKIIGFKRVNNIVDLKGDAAPILWHKYCKGDLDSLKLLISYNHADIEGMKRIFDVSVDKLMKQQEIPEIVQGKHLFSGVKNKLNWLKKKKYETDQGIKIYPYSGEYRSLITFDDLNAVRNLSTFRVVGLDITGSESKPSGWCLSEGKYVKTKRLLTDLEIIEATVATKPDLISIDSPLSLPKGRLTVDDNDPGRSIYGITRECERLLKRRGVNVYPSLIRSMQGLTARGIRLAQYFRGQGIPVIESYPGAAQDIMRIPRKQAGLEFLSQGLSDFGIEGDFQHNSVSHDELDAITSAIVGLFFWTDKFEGLGNDDEEVLIIPEIVKSSSIDLSRKVIGISGSIASGKTTLATRLKSCDFHYTRFSQILANILNDRGIDSSREALQQLGIEVHKNPGQRWLCKQVVKGFPGNVNLVVDGLRFPEDHAFLVEKFGSAFVHVHLSISKKLSLERYITRGGSESEYLEASSSLTEVNIPKLASLAHMVISDTEDLESFMSNFTENATKNVKCI